MTSIKGSSLVGSEEQAAQVNGEFGYGEVNGNQREFGCVFLIAFGLWPWLTTGYFAHALAKAANSLPLPVKRHVGGMTWGWEKPKIDDIQAGWHAYTHTPSTK